MLCLNPTPPTHATGLTVITSLQHCGVHHTSNCQSCLLVIRLTYSYMVLFCIIDHSSRSSNKQRTHFYFFHQPDFILSFIVFWLTGGKALGSWPWLKSHANTLEIDYFPLRFVLRQVIYTCASVAYETKVHGCIVKQERHKYRQTLRCVCACVLRGSNPDRAEVVVMRIWMEVLFLFTCFFFKRCVHICVHSAKTIPHSITL